MRGCLCSVCTADCEQSPIVRLFTAVRGIASATVGALDGTGP